MARTPLDRPDDLVWDEANISVAQQAAAARGEVLLFSTPAGSWCGSRGRPNTLVRYPDGIDGEFFFQKRAPASRPRWLDVVTIRFPSGRTADEIVPTHAADLAWLAVVTGARCCRRREGSSRAARRAGWPKTSGKRGLQVLVRIETRVDARSRAAGGAGASAAAPERMSLNRRGLLFVCGFACRQLVAVKRIGSGDIEIQRHQVAGPIVSNFVAIATLYQEERA